MPDLLTVAEYSVTSGLAECCIRKFISRGMPHYPIGPKKFKVSPDECREWMAKHIRRSVARDPKYHKMFNQIQADQKSRRKKECADGTIAT